jgi:hypothetical protein
MTNPNENQTNREAVSPAPDLASQVVEDTRNAVDGMITTERAPITPATFFGELSRWKEWVDKSLSDSQKSLSIAESKPAGAQHNSNLYMAEDGTIWASYGEDWYEMKRKSDEPYAEYEKVPKFKRGKEEIANGSVQSVVRPDGTKLVFVNRSWNDMKEDWGWEVKKSGLSTARYYKESVDRENLGLQLANTLIAKQDEIEKWMDTYAKGQGELRDTEKKKVDGKLRVTDRNIRNLDWSSLIERFAPNFKYIDVPDNGSLLSSLHVVLDQIALGRQLRTYYS